jgi:hypothetical protein
MARYKVSEHHSVSFFQSDTALPTQKSHERICSRSGVNYSMGTLNSLKDLGFMYDASASSAGGKDYYPYTLDNGLANDCWKGVCGPSAKFPGVFEIPMYTVTDDANTERLMDVYLDGRPSDAKTCKSKQAFVGHYELSLSLVSCHYRDIESVQ